MKRVVESERRARRPEPKRDPIEQACDVLREAEPIGFVDLPGDEEFVLLVARRVPGGGLAVLSPITDKAFVERGLRMSVR
jgi:hypothetical protein